MTVAQQDLQQERYGRRPERFTHTQRYIAITIALTLASIGMYVVYRNAQPDVVGTANTWTPTGPKQEIIHWQVNKPTSATVSCVVRARDADGAEVGRTVVVVTDRGTIVHVTTTLPTTSLAVTGEVEDCVTGTNAS